VLTAVLDTPHMTPEEAAQEAILNLECEGYMGLNRELSQ
jgi:hypothetical protein